MTASRRARCFPELEIELDRVADQKWSVADLLLPALTLRQSALLRNAELFESWCLREQVEHFPHAKTHLSPELVRLQLDAGAPGMTVATVSQARLVRQFGARRVLIANEVTDRAGVSWLGSVLAQDPDFDVLVLVDSVELVSHLDAVLGEQRIGRRLGVLVELGVLGGRAGARTVAAGLEVGRAVAASRCLEAVGVEGYEGFASPDRSVESLGRVDAFLQQLGGLAVALDATGAFDARGEIVFTAGGSSYPDRVAAVGRTLPALSQPIRVIVRSGAYLTFEHGWHGSCSPLSPESLDPLGALRPAFELWSSVLSTPEPELAILGFGKRDAPFDIAMPTVLGVRGEGVERELPGAIVTKVNDQHAYLSGATGLRCGEVVRLGITHPCTAFDKWPVIPVLDDEDQVIDVVTTLF